MRASLVLGALLAALATVPGCFTPAEPPCAFSCVTPSQKCPEGYTCDPATGLCMNPKGKGACTLAPLVDGGTSDGAAD